MANDARLLGSCPAFLAVLEDARAVAPHDSFAVLILGENGTGKEELARYIHAMSGRSKGPFVAVNCAAISRELWESEMFGHERGAFTGAAKAKKGLFELADGGVLFLDEIGDMPLDQQVKLLRVVQRQEIRRVGAETVRPVNVRIIAATNRDLRAMVKQGQFRDDLFFRIAQWTLEQPPLRDRGDDILTIARDGLQRKGFGGQPLTTDAEQLLRTYSWPGNIRELVNAVTSGAVRSKGGPIEAAHLRPALLEKSSHRDTACPTDSREQAPVATLPAAARASLDCRRQLELERAARIVEELLALKGWFTRPKFDARCGMRRSKSQRTLDALANQGVVRQQGAGRAKIYVRGDRTTQHASAASA